MKLRSKIRLALLALFAFAAMGQGQLFAATTLTGASGGGSISADNSLSGAWTTLTGPVTAETTVGQIGTGTIVLTAPSGFQFNTTAGTAVMVTGGSTNANNLNGLASGSTIAATVSSTTITITITSKSTGSGNLNTLTWQNIQVQPTAGTPLASGNLSRSGTASGLATGNWGTLTEVGGTAAALAFTTQPVGGVYGAALTTQPVVKSQDQFGNNSVSGLGASLLVNLALTTGNGALTGTTSSDLGTAHGNGTATFAGLKVNAAGSGDIVTASSSGLASANSTSFNVSQAALTVSGITATSRVYDGTTNAALNVGSASLVGIVSGDTVTLNTVSATGAFATKTAGTGKAVTVSGLTLSGASSANYNLTAPTPSANITKAALTVFGIAANNKVYDGSTVAALNLGGASLVNVVSGDTVTLNTGSATGAFAAAAAGTGVTVTVSGLTISGADAANYSLTQPTTIANITVATLTVSATGINKTYDGTTNATATLADNRVTGDKVTLTYVAGFADKNVQTGKPLSVNAITITGGADAANYVLGNTSASATANITVRTLTVTPTASNKVYDGTTAATVTMADNRVSGDSLTVNYTNAVFSSATVGNNKTVTVSGITLSGTDASNYSAAAAATDTANITAKGLTVSGVTGINKVYNGNTTATVSTNGAGLVGVIGGDAVSLSGTASGTFADKNVGAGKTVTVAGLTLSGASAGNYTVTQPTTTADITAATLTVSATGVNRAYDGTTNATVTLSDNHLGSDSVTTTYSSATFGDKNVGTGKPVSVSGIAITGGTAAGNYVLGNTTASSTANITAKSLTVSVTAFNKVYDRTNTATVTFSDNRVAGDSLTATNSIATFSSATVGNNKTVTVTGISISGADAGNYNLASTTGTDTANITAKPLTVSGMTASNKVYNGNTAATVSTNTVNLVGVIAGDTVNLSGTAAGAFSDKNVGTTKTVTISGLTLAGASAANYTVTQPTTTADITTATLTVTATGINRAYDGTTNATVTLADNHLGADIVTTSYGTAGFADKNVANGKSVSVSSIAISGGTDSGNYTIGNTTASTTANITRATLAVTATGINKVYDKTTAASVTLADNRSSGDSLTASFTSATFATVGVGTGKTVTVSGISISGTDAGNYTANTSSTTTANITAKPLTVSGVTASNKVYNATALATISSAGATLTGVISGDTVNLGGTASGTFSDKNVGNGKTVAVSGLTISGSGAVNYSLTQPTPTANITPAPLTVTATGISKLYDGTAAATVNLSATAIGTDSVSAAYSSAAFADKNAGNGKVVNVIGISLSGPDGGNYTPNSTASTTANITRTTLTVTAQDTSRAYGQPDPTFTVNYSGFVNGETLGTSGLSGSPLVSSTSSNTSPPGAYAIIPSTGSLQALNYQFSFVNGTLTVLPGALAFFDDFSRAQDPGPLTPWTQESGNWTVTGGALFGGPNPTGHYGVLFYDTNWVDYSVEARIQFPEGAFGGGIAGRLDATTGARYSAWVYPEGSSGGSNVLKLIKFQAWSFFGYTNASSVPMVQVSLPGVGTNWHNLKLAFHGAEITVFYDGTQVISATDSETAPYTRGGISVDMWTETAPYAMGIDNVAVIQTLAEQLITFGPLADSTYGAAPFEIDATASSGLPVSLSVVSGPATIVSNTITLTGAGVVTIRASQVGDSNYNPATSIDESFTVNPAPLTITADAKSKAYGDADPVLTYQITTGSLVGTDTISGNLARAAGEQAGTYAIQQGTLDGGPNYALTFIPANLAIGQKAITITADAKTKTYGDADPVLTYQITTGSLVGSDAPSGSPTRVAGEQVGNYAIQPGTLDVGPNYALTFIPANLAIGQKAITITADAKTKTYGDADPVLTYQITSGSLVGTDAPIGSLTRVPGENAALYAIQQSSLTAGANYDLTFVPATLTILPKTLLAQADNQSRAYGMTNPVFTIVYTGFAGADSVTNLALPPEAGTLADTNSPIGNYDITLTGGNDTNYTLVLSNGTLAVTAEAITVTANPQSKIYGDADPALTYQITSGALLPGDSLNGNLTRVDGEAIGTYAIQQGTLDAGTNYTLTFVPANLAIGQKAITITADAKTKPYGDIDPALTYQISSGSLVGTDTLSGNVTRVSGEQVGNYAIQQGTLDAGTNYTLTFVPANLAIGQKAITITADAKTKTYGDVDPLLTYQFTSGSLVGTDTLSGSVTRAAGEQVGDYSIQQGTLDGGGNYSLTFVSANLSITPTSSSLAIMPSENPSTVGSLVTFTATVSPVAPAASTPTGNVQFLTNGVAVEGPVTLISGVATMVISNLASGTNLITAVYAGDFNYFGSSNAMAQVVNAVVQQPTTLGIQNNGDGSITVSFSGTPGAQYITQAASDLGSPESWSNVSTNTAAADGTWSLTESTAGQSVRFYRAGKP